VSKPSISIVTTTLNCAELIPGLIKSLLAQSDRDFDWVVADGGSTDGTIEAVRQFPSDRVQVIAGRDFGIYDALNKALAGVTSDYYLVVGADDSLTNTAVASYKRAASIDNPDIVAAAVKIGPKLLTPMRGARWLRGGNAFVASHAVGTLIRRSLHDTVGYYSRRYVNCADMYFILKALDAGNAQLQRADFVAGEFSLGGISSQDRLCSLSDAFRIQVDCGANKPTQTLLYLMRLVRALFRSTGD
jgi:glycosyltransferase involved in cell wall biosynthesis